MGVIDTLRTNSEAANNEIIIHFELRDRVLLGFIAAVGTLISIALSRAHNEILFSIPYLALGCSILVSQHNLLIGTLLDYVSNEVGPFIKQNLSEEYAPQYQTSKAYKRDAVKALKFRLYGHSIIITGPCLLALVLNINYTLNPISAYGLIWWTSLICSIGAGCLIIGGHIKRIRIKQKDHNN